MTTWTGSVASMTRSIASRGLWRERLARAPREPSRVHRRDTDMGHYITRQGTEDTLGIQTTGTWRTSSVSFSSISLSSTSLAPAPCAPCCTSPVSTSVCSLRSGASGHGDPRQSKAEESERKGRSRLTDDPVHPVLRVLEARATERSEDRTGQEGEPGDLVPVRLRLLHGGRSSADDATVDARDRVEALTRVEEADELAEVLRIEAERDGRGDCGRGPG